METKEKYDTTISTKDLAGSITIDPKYQTNNSFCFDSMEWSTDSDVCKKAFLPETNNYDPDNMNNSLTIVFTNTAEQEEEELPAPTGFTSRYTPFILMMAFGLLFLTIGAAGLIGKKKRLPDKGSTKTRVQSHKQWVEYRTPLVRGAPPSAPPCLRANLWMHTKGSPGKRGDPGG